MMIKTITFAAIHFSIATFVAFILTGDFLLGSLIAIIEPSINTCAFYVHEKTWQRVPFLQRRALATQTKTLSFAVIHFSVAFTVAYLLTGNPLIGGAIAIIEPSINSVAYFFHEKIWINKQLNSNVSMLSA